MKEEKFNKIVVNRIEKIKSVLQHKSKEYALDNDRLYNFKVAARIVGANQQKVLQGMFLKHLVSVFDLIDGKLNPTVELIDEKIGDTINYLILLEAVFLEDIDLKIPDKISSRAAAVGQVAGQQGSSSFSGAIANDQNNSPYSGKLQI